MELNRLRAAANINRWMGWTTRPYSILEHMIVGTETMDEMGLPLSAQRLFLIHDLHETEFVGDVPTPHKRLYCNQHFDAACDAFDADLIARYRLDVTPYDRFVAAAMDHRMARVEHSVLVTRKVDGIRPMDRSIPSHVDIEWRLNVIGKMAFPAYILPARWMQHAKRLGMVS